MHNMIETLLKYCETSDDVKSSHWKHFTSNFSDPYAVKAISGFGTFTKLSFINSVFNFVFRPLVFGNLSQKTKIFGIFKQIANQQNRVMDVDMCRHLLTFDMFDSKIPNFRNIESVCVIGDGRTNFLSPAIKTPSFTKIISINLPEVLINEILILRNWSEISDSQIAVVESKKHMEELMGNDTIRVLLVPAQLAEVVKNQSIDFFVNIASMQEMMKKTVDEYFDIIKSNNALFYCCNRESKTLYGGEQLNFFEYEWGECEILLDEDCPWHQKFYTNRPPFIRNYDGNIIHRLVKYN